MVVKQPVTGGLMDSGQERCAWQLASWMRNKPEAFDPSVLNQSSSRKLCILHLGFCCYLDSKES